MGLAPAPTAAAAVPPSASVAPRVGVPAELIRMALSTDRFQTSRPVHAASGGALRGRSQPLQTTTEILCRKKLFERNRMRCIMRLASFRVAVAMWNLMIKDHCFGLQDLLEQPPIYTCKTH